MLDLDGGAPWDLLCSLMQAAPRKRLSAAAAAAHPALGGGLTGAINSALWRLGDAADKVWQHPAQCHASQASYLSITNAGRKGTSHLLSRDVLEGRVAFAITSIIAVL